jgi:diguanylate cyclase
VEVTESMIMQNLDSTVNTLRSLRSRGVAIAIDDFGTGHSSLHYLRRLPIDVLKIDRSFIRNLDKADSEDRLITSMIVSLGRALKLRIVAEGVEQPQQLQWLREIGCNEVQGYLVSRPMSSEEFCSLVTGRERASA